MTNPVRNESGFTIVEVLVAMVILLVGVAGTLKMVDDANGLGSNTRHRDAAINLARQLTEAARNLDYQNQLTTAAIVPALQAQNGLNDANLAQSGWQIVRRGTSFTVTATVCTYDDPKDGTRANDNGHIACQGESPAGVGKVDQNPDDFRRVHFDVTWRRAGHPVSCASDSGGFGGNCVSQTTLVPNPNGGLGPAIDTITHDDPVQNVTPASTHISFTTKSSAESVSWSVNDGVSQGTANDLNPGTDTSWDLTWPFTSPDVDGTYTVTLQAFSLGVGGPVRQFQIKLNRFIPTAPQVDPKLPPIGLNTRIAGQPIVELAWRPNPEHDLDGGYRVYRGTSPDLPGSSNLVCNIPDSRLTSCFDATAPAGAASYYIVAIDERYVSPRSNDPAEWAACPFPPVVLLLADPAWPSPFRPGCPSNLASWTIPDTQTTLNQAPQWDVGGPAPTVALATGLPRVDWTTRTATDPDAGDSILFYRIYRDPSCTGATGSTTDYTNRCDKTASGTVKVWDDLNPPASGTPVTYYVTAVDNHYQESPPIQTATFTMP